MPEPIANQNTEPVQETDQEPIQEPKPEPVTPKKDSNAKWIAFIVIAALVSGSLGFAFGSDSKETELTQSYNEQVEELESEAEAAKKSAGSTVQEGQQTLESLQAENTELKATIEEQSDEIADLEKQLEEAEADSTTAPPIEN